MIEGFLQVYYGITMGGQAYIFLRSVYLFQDQGYAPDFVQVAMAPYIKDIKKKGNLQPLYLFQNYPIYWP